MGGGGASAGNFCMLLQDLLIHVTANILVQLRICKIDVDTTNCCQYNGSRGVQVVQL